MKHFAPLTALALLAACATPQEQCINSAANEVSTIRNHITTLNGNISRGYAVHHSQEQYQTAEICFDTEHKPYTCHHTAYRSVETPVTIDVADQRRKLAELKRRLPAATQRMNQGIASCRAAHPK